MTRLISTVEETGKSGKTVFFLGQNSCRSAHSAFALVKLLSTSDESRSPDEVLLLTPRAADGVDHELLREEGNRFGMKRVLFKSMNDNGSSPQSIFRQVTNWTDEPNCIVDLTGMDRELVAVFNCYVSAMQTSETSVRSTDLFVGVPNREDEIHFKNLQYVTNWPGWSGAYDVFKKLLEGGPLSKRFVELHNDSYKNSNRPESRHLQQLGNMLNSSTRNLTAALPMESGLAGHRTSDTFWKDVKEDADQLNPFINHLVPGVREYFRDIGVTGNHSDKLDVPLTEDELKRQYRCAQRLAESEKLLPAYLLARELLVNGALLGTSQSVPPGTWLDGETRSRAAAPFYLLHHWNQYDELRELPDEQQRRVSSLWGAIKTQRNKLAHAGFCNEPIRFDHLSNAIKNKLEEIGSLTIQNRDLLENLLTFPFDDHLFIFGTTNRTPEGCHELKLLRNELDYISSIIILVPEEFDTGSFQERWRDRTNISVNCWKLRNQDGGFQYWEKLWKQHRKTILSNATVTLSIAEGTTAMQHTVRQVFNQISQFGIETELVGYERARSTDEVSGLVTVDSNWTS